MLDLNNVNTGAFIDVETRSRHYSIECLGGTAIRISGHPQYCPDPAVAEFYGSVDEQGEVALSVIEPGMRLTFLINEIPITTSKVASVHFGQQELN